MNFKNNIVNDASRKFMSKNAEMYGREEVVFSCKDFWKIDPKSFSVYEWLYFCKKKSALGKQMGKRNVKETLKNPK